MATSECACKSKRGENDPSSSRSEIFTDCKEDHRNLIDSAFGSILDHPRFKKLLKKCHCAKPNIKPVYSIPLLDMPCSPGVEGKYNPLRESSESIGRFSKSTQDLPDIIIDTYTDNSLKSPTKIRKFSNDFIRGLKDCDSDELSFQSSGGNGSNKDADTDAKKSTKYFRPRSSSFTVRPKYTLLQDGEMRVRCLDCHKTVVANVVSVKILKKMEFHTMYLDDFRLTSKKLSTSSPGIGCGVLQLMVHWTLSTNAFIDAPFKHTSIQDVHTVSKWDSDEAHYLKITVPGGPYLLQTSVQHARDQWYYSILWKKNIHRYRSSLKANVNKPDVFLNQLTSMVKFVMDVPLQGDDVYRVPIDIISEFLPEAADIWNDEKRSISLISSLSPLLETCPPTEAICEFFSHHCKIFPTSEAIRDYMFSSVYYILKHNVDFAKQPSMKNLVTRYMKALSLQEYKEENLLREFVSSVHGENYECPHNRVLTNMVCVCLTSIFGAFEEESTVEEPKPDAKVWKYEEPSSSLENCDCYLRILSHISCYKDWVPAMGQLLQPLPVPQAALKSTRFLRSMAQVLENICVHEDCEAHRTLLPVRKEKDGWFDVYSPSNPHCPDDGRLWELMLTTLLNCCCRLKSFITRLSDRLFEAVILLSLRGNNAAQTALCLMLEWQVTTDDDKCYQITTTLKSTESGNQHYEELCKRQLHLQEFQQKGGPEKLSVPCRSTDKDFQTLLSSGSYGNLVHLSLCFTYVTSACADILIKLPSLKILNLWATKFGDSGLVTISEHLVNLESLNLCETPVTDNGILAIVAFKKLKRLNLNSTKLTFATYKVLKKELPAIKDIDIRYTDAYEDYICAEQRPRVIEKIPAPDCGVFKDCRIFGKT